MANGDITTWSTTAASNATADPDINWAEGQAPGTVNNSARTMMSALAKYRDAMLKRATAAVDLYVRTDGSDSNTGLANTAGGAFLTIQKAINVAQYNYDSGGFAVTIHVADGTYTAGGNITQVPVGFNQITITGNTTTPANCVISAANGFVVQDFATAAIAGFKFTGAGTSIQARQFGIVDFNSCTFMGSGTAITSDNGSISINAAGAGVTIDANMTAVLFAANGGTINLGGQTITMANARTITYFALVQSLGTIDASATFSGSGAGANMTGQQYLVTDGTLIYTNALPGSITGQRTHNTGTPTNDNAPTGGVGEYKESIVLFANRIGLTTATAANVTTISLGAGDWDVSGGIGYFAAATTVVSSMISGISSTSATAPASGNPGRVAHTGWPNGGGTMAAVDIAGIPPVRFSLSTTTTIYLVANSAFTTSTMEAFGFLTARRVR